MSEKRQNELKKTLQQLKDGKIDATAASQTLNRMFDQIENDMSKIKTAVEAPGKGIKTAIDIQYVGLADSLEAAGKESLRTLTTLFGNYKGLLNEQLQNTIAGTAELNRVLGKTGDNVMRSFNDFKGMSVQATKETASLMSRSVDSLLKTMTMDEIKPFLVSTTKAFQKHFKAISFELPEAEAKYYKLAAAFDALGVGAEKSAKYFQDMKNIGRMSADEFATASLEIQKVAEITNSDFDGMMAKFHKLVVEQGYDRKTAIANLKEMELQAMKTGVKFDDLTDIFGKGMDNFSQIAPKVAELNSVFKLRLNPAAMTRMTAKQRAEYVTNALKNSNVDLNSRLLQRQLSSVFDSEESARKYLSSIRNTNAATAEAIQETRKKLDAVGTETVSGAEALEKLQKTAVNQMDPSKALTLKQREAASQAQIAAAGGRDEKGNLKLEDKALSSYQARLALQKRLFAESQTEAGKYIQNMVVNFKMMQAEFGVGPIKGLNVGNIIAGSATVATMVQQMSAKMIEANDKTIANKNKEMQGATDARKKVLEADIKKLKEANKQLEANANDKALEKLKGKPQEIFKEAAAYLQASSPKPGEKPGDTVARAKAEVKSGASALASGASSAADSVVNSVDSLVKALKTMPIVLKLNSEELTRVVLETSTGKK